MTATGATCTNEAQKQSCSRTEGECKAGERTCNKGQWSACSETEPVAELCDGKDNDCDGKTDEDFPDLGSACTVGQGECVAAGTLVCGGGCSATALAPSAELCDGKDNDCDGTVDNHITNGPTCPLTLGVCANTHASCAGGAFASCGAASYGGHYDPAVAETQCDGLDNNCDGQVDEGYVFKIGDVTVSELVPCPQQIWCDATTSACGNTPGSLLAGGANGVPFDTWPATTSLGANLAQNAWVEVQSHLACPIALSAITFSIGPAGTAHASDGSDCQNIPAHGFCVVQMPSLLGSDGTPFTRTVTLTIGGVAVDTATANVSTGCNGSCRNSTRSQACCSSEGLARQSDGSFLAHPATPLYDDSALDRFYPAQAATVQFTEALALDANMADSNGDGSLTGDQDDFVEIQALRDLSLGGVTLKATKGSSATEHVFSCFAPLRAGERVAIFGGGTQLPAHAIASSVGAPAFDLPRDTAMTFALGGIAGVSFSASAFSGGAAGSRQSEELCGGSFTNACTCHCLGESSGDIASCNVDCGHECDHTTAPQSASCFSPGQ